MVLTGPNITFRKHRNNYARLLLNMVMTRHLSDPFNTMPPEGPLPSFPIHAKAITKDMLGVHESSFWRELYGKLQDEPTENLHDRSSILNILNNSHHDTSFTTNTPSTSAIKGSTLSREITTFNLLVKEQNNRIQLLEQQLQEERVQYELKIQRLQYMHRQQINQYVAVLANNSLPVPSLNMSTSSLHGLPSPNQSMMQDMSNLSQHALPSRSTNSIPTPSINNLSMNMLNNESTLSPSSIFSKGNTMRGSNRYHDASDETPLRPIPPANHTTTTHHKPSTFPVSAIHGDISTQSIGHEQNTTNQSMLYPPPPPPSIATLTPSMSTTMYSVSPMTHQTTYDTSMEQINHEKQSNTSLSTPKASISPYSSSENPLSTTPYATTQTSILSLKTHPSVTFAPQLTTTTLISPAASSASNMSPMFSTANEAEMIHSRQTMRLSDPAAGNSAWTIDSQVGREGKNDEEVPYDIVPRFRDIKTITMQAQQYPDITQPSPRSSIDSSNASVSKNSVTNVVGTIPSGYTFPHSQPVYTPSQPMISSINSLPTTQPQQYMQPVYANPTSHYHEVMISNSLNESSILPIPAPNRLKIESGYSSSDTAGGHSSGSVRSASSLTHRSGNAHEMIQQAAAIINTALDEDHGSVRSHHSQSSRMSQLSQHSQQSVRSHQSQHTQQSQHTLQSHHTLQSQHTQQSHLSQHTIQSQHSQRSAQSHQSNRSNRETNMQIALGTSYGVPLDQNSFGGIAMAGPTEGGTTDMRLDDSYPQGNIVPSSSNIHSDEGLSSSDEDFLEYIDQFQAQLRAASSTLPSIS